MDIALQLNDEEISSSLLVSNLKSWIYGLSLTCFLPPKISENYSPHTLVLKILMILKMLHISPKFQKFSSQPEELNPPRVCLPSRTSWTMSSTPQHPDPAPPSLQLIFPGSNIEIMIHTE